MATQANIQALRYAQHLLADPEFHTELADSYRLWHVKVEGEWSYTCEHLGCLGVPGTKAGLMAVVAFAACCHGATTPVEDGEMISMVALKYVLKNGFNWCLLQHEFATAHQAIQAVIDCAVASDPRLKRKLLIPIEEVVRRFEAPVFEGACRHG